MNYEKLAVLYEEIGKTSKRLEKTEIISTFLKKCEKEDLKLVIYLLQGRVFPQSDEKKLGMSSKLLVRAIHQATGESTDNIEKGWRDEGDLGLVVEKFAEHKKQNTLFSKKLTLKKVVDNIQKLTEMEGTGTVNKKIGLVAELLSSASPVEAKYIVRTVAETLRTGIGDGMIRDSLLWTFYPNIKELREDREKYKVAAEELQHAFNVTNDFGVLAEILEEKGQKGLIHAQMVVGKPIKAMLYPKVQNIEEGFEVVGKPAIIEPKLDGFRVQIHRIKDDIKLFTRRLEEVTKQFPDVVKVVKDNVRSKDFILDSEVVGIDSKTKRAIPFQNISQRIRRKHDIEKLVKLLPVVVHVFDIIELNGENLLTIPLHERKKLLQAVLKSKTNSIHIIDQLVTSDAKKTESYYKECLDMGHEGIMMKMIEGPYKPGKRVGQGVKVKPVMESLDLVIVEAHWGEGKRAKWFSSFTVACKDGDTLKKIGKVGTGIKEKSEEGVTFLELTTELKKLIINEKGKTVTVKPQVILEIIYEEIQKSPTYSSGYALRFPRVHRLRLDKGLSEINSLDDIDHLFNAQKK